MSDDTRARVSKVEREIDGYFDRQLRVRGIYRPALISALLDVAEMLVTGHRAPDEKYSQAIRALYINVVNGLNWSLRAAHRLGSDDRRAVPTDPHRIAHDCISDGMAYPFVEDAFFSYWKGYATVTFPGDKEILFTPTGEQLDARLRRHDSRDEIEVAAKPAKTNPLLDPSSPLAKRFVKSLMKRSKVKRIGGFIWNVDRDVVKAVANIICEFIASRVDASEIELDDVSLSDLVRGIGVVCAVSQIHSLVSIITGDDPTDVSTSLNWPALYRDRREWLRWFSLLGADERVLSILTFDCDDKNADVAITPLVSVDAQYLGVVPSVVLRSNWPRNLLVLLARKFGAAYSTYSASKEDRLLAAFSQSQPGLVRGQKIRLPEWQGRRLPDIDMVLSDAEEKLVVIAEMKWQLSASDTRDIIARNEYLKKGVGQLTRIRDFLSENPGYLRERQILNGFTEADRTVYALLCKGHLGSEDVIQPGIVMADWDVFSDYVGRFPLQKAMQRLGAYDYLPIQGRDFTVETTRLQFGEWVLGWKQFHAPELPPDTETEALEALYRSAYKFFPRGR